MTQAKNGAEAFPTSIFRARFEFLQKRDGLTLGDVASYLGWLRDGPSHEAKSYPNGTHVARVLGYREYSSGKNGAHVVREFVDYDLAVRLCDALSMDYFEAGV